MPRNLEVKARLPDLARTRRAVEALGARHVTTEHQVDRYYQLDGARRCKLRIIRGAGAHLIRYERPERHDIRTSHYEITPVRDAAAARCLLPKGQPVIVVRKRREIHLLDNVRIHLDRVLGLGTFLELEAVVDAHHDDATCTRQVEAITRALGVPATAVIRASYAELLGARGVPTAEPSAWPRRTP